MTYYSNTKGFSLIEVTLYISVSMVIMFAVASVYTVFVIQSVKSKTVQAVIEESYSAIETFERLMKNADTVVHETDSLRLQTSQGEVRYFIDADQLRLETSQGSEFLTNATRVRECSFIPHVNADAEIQAVTFNCVFRSLGNGLRNEVSFEQSLTKTITLRH